MKRIKKGRPNRLEIGWVTYQINYCPRLIESNGDHYFGQHRGSEKIIDISEEYGPERGKVALLHEVIHGIDQLSGLELEEKEIRGLANSLYEVGIRNPEIIKYIFG